MPCSVPGSLINPGPFVSLASYMDIGLASGLASYADIGHFFTNFDSGLDTRSVLGTPHWFPSSLGGLLRLA